MAQIIDIRRVEVAPKSFTARVRVAIGAPLLTSDDLEGTTRVYRLLPRIIEHTCLGDAGETFKDVMGDTEVAHLLEHVTVELLAQTDIAGDIPCGRTWAVPDERRTYDIEFPCPDDVLVAGALSSAVWILQWAYSGGGDPEPDVDATVRGLVSLVQSLPEPQPAPDSVREYVVYGEEAAALVREAAGEEAEPEPQPVEEPEAEAALEPAGQSAFDAGSTMVSEPLVLGDVVTDKPKESPEARQASQDEPEQGDMLSAEVLVEAEDAAAAAQAAEELLWGEGTNETDAAFGAGLADDAFDEWEDIPAPKFVR